MSLISSSAARIARLNDRHRHAPGMYGDTYTSAGMRGLTPAQKSACMEAVETFADFHKGNDPYGEHDKAIIDVNGIRIIFEFTYYERGSNREYASPDPANPTVTDRVCSIMLIEER